MSDFSSRTVSALLKGGGLGALAIAVAAIAVPAQASAQMIEVGLRDHNAQETTPASPRQGSYRGGDRSRAGNDSGERARPGESRGEWRPQQNQDRGGWRPSRAANDGHASQSGVSRPRGDWNRNDRENRGDAARSWRGQDPSPRVGGGQSTGRTTWRSGNGGDWRDDDASRRRDRGDSWRNRDNARRDSNTSWRSRDNTWHDSSGWRDNDGRFARDYRNWDRRWRDNNRYNWYSYRERNRDHYRIGRYYAPYRGYSYRRLGIGFSLGSLFYSSRYWISDPWEYRLPEVYGPYRWVRYYDDVLLVDIRTGEVVDVIHDFFW